LNGEHLVKEVAFAESKNEQILPTLKFHSVFTKRKMKNVSDIADISDGKTFAAPEQDDLAEGQAAQGCCTVS